MFVAIGSLDIAFLQYQTASAASAEAKDARAQEQAQVEASEAAIDEIFSTLDANAKEELNKKFSPKLLPSERSDI